MRHLWVEIIPYCSGETTMSRDGSSQRALYIRRKGKWIRIGTINSDKKIIFQSNVDTIIEEVFAEWLK